MKARRVLVTIEMTSDMPLKELKSINSWSQYLLPNEEIHQIQANVIKKEKEVKK